MKHLSLTAGPVLLALGACTGSIGDAPGVAPDSTNDPMATTAGRGGQPPLGGRGGGTGTVGQGGASGSPGGNGARPLDLAGPMPLRRLSAVEYRNTVRDLALVPDLDAVLAGLPVDATGAHGFSAAGDRLSNVEVDRLLETAERIAAAATAPDRLAATLGCSPAAKTEEACVREFVFRFGRRATRRPLTPTEADELVAYYAKSRRELTLDHAGGVRLVLGVMLQAPSFLYRLDPVAARPTGDGGLVRLGPHDLAARLSYSLWASIPDAPLAAAADAGRLGTPAEIAAQADRMAKDPKARPVLQAFFEEWLDLGALPRTQKDPKLVPNAPALMAAFGRETRAFLGHVLTDGGGRLDTLFAAPFTFVDAELARHYGLPPVVGTGTGTGMVKVPLPPARLGLLTQGSLLSVHAHPNGTSPVRRGQMVLERFLCKPAPPPPPGLMIAPPPPDPKLQVRAQYEQHSRDPSCHGCHVQMDPLGFALESFDLAGRHRTVEAGKPVDATAVIPALDGADRKVTGAADLARLLSESDEVRACLVRQWFRFALGRKELPEEEGSVTAALDEFRRAGWDVRTIPAAVAKTRAFQFRAPYAWETR